MAFCFCCFFLTQASVETWQGPVDTPFVLGKKLTLGTYARHHIQHIFGSLFGRVRIYFECGSFAYDFLYI